jgi:hypothetical protein
MKYLGREPRLEEELGQYHLVRHAEPNLQPRIAVALSYRSSIKNSKQMQTPAAASDRTVDNQTNCAAYSLATLSLGTHGSRARIRCTFSASHILNAAMKSYPCGWSGDGEKSCICSPSVVARYQKRISGPLIDRIDIHVDVPRVNYEKLSGKSCGTSGT